MSFGEVSGKAQLKSYFMDTSTIPPVWHKNWHFSHLISWIATSFFVSNSNYNNGFYNCDAKLCNSLFNSGYAVIYKSKGETVYILFNIIETNLMREIIAHFFTALNILYSFLRFFHQLFSPGNSKVIYIYF